MRDECLNSNFWASRVPARAKTGRRRRTKQLKRSRLGIATISFRRGAISAPPARITTSRGSASNAGGRGYFHSDSSPMAGRLGKRRPVASNPAPHGPRFALYARQTIGVHAAASLNMLRFDTVLAFPARGQHRVDADTRSISPRAIALCIRRVDRIGYPMLATFTTNSAKSTRKSSPSQREMRLSCVRR